jgi:Tetratricopeptide repeat/PEGA domain
MLLVILSASSVFAFVRPVHGSPQADREAGAALTQAGLVLAKQGRYDEAVDLLERAHAIDPAPILLYNIAYVLEKKGDAPAALSFYRRYVAEEILPEDRGRAVTRIRRLEAEIPAWLVLRCSLPGAVVELDGEVIARGPVNTRVRVAPGSHSLRVFEAGHAPFEETIELAPGQSVTRGPGLLTVLREQRPVAAADASPPRPQAVARDPQGVKGSGDKRRMWGLISGGVAIVVGGLVATYILLEDDRPSRVDAVWSVP